MSAFHCRRPQKARGETMRYFRQLGPLLENAERQAQVHRGGANFGQPLDEESELSLLIVNSLNEMVGQEASLASNADTSFVVQKLITHMTPRQLFAVTHNLSGLYSHLFTNRYASFVVQTLLRKVAKFLLQEVDVEEFSNCIRNIAEEISEHFLSIIKDQCGSPVIRTLVLVLNGFAPESTRRQFSTTDLKKQRKRKKAAKKKKEALGCV